MGRGEGDMARSVHNHLELRGTASTKLCLPNFGPGVTLPNIPELTCKTSIWEAICGTLVLYKGLFQKTFAATYTSLS